MKDNGREWRRVAIRWWEALRPSGWSESDHLLSPFIGCVGKAEVAMARKVSKWLRFSKEKL